MRLEIETPAHPPQDTKPVADPNGRPQRHPGWDLTPMAPFGTAPVVQGALGRVEWIGNVLALSRDLSLLERAEHVEKSDSPVLSDIQTSKNWNHTCWMPQLTILPLCQQITAGMCIRFQHYIRSILGRTLIHTCFQLRHTGTIMITKVYFSPFPDSADRLPLQVGHGRPACPCSVRE